MKMILVVDDDADIRRMAELILKDEYNVITAGDAFEAQFLCSVHPIDLVLTDVEMPHVTGIELAKQLSQNFAGMKIVLMSGGVKCGEGFPLISKPYTIKDLLSTVSETLRYHDARPAE